MTKDKSDVIKRFREKFVSDWLLDDGSDNLLWKDKVPTPNEIKQFILTEIEAERKSLLEEVEGIIGNDEPTQIKEAHSSYQKGYRMKSIGQAYTRNKLRAEQRIKLEELKQ